MVGDHEVELLRTMAGFPVFEVEDGDAEWQVVFGCGIERPAQWEDLYDFSFEEVVMDSMFAKTDEAYYYIMEPHDKTVPPMLMRYVGFEQDAAGAFLHDSASGKGCAFPGRVGHGEEYPHPSLAEVYSRLASAERRLPSAGR